MDTLSTKGSLDSGILLNTRCVSANIDKQILTKYKISDDDIIQTSWGHLVPTIC